MQSFNAIEEKCQLFARGFFLFLKVSSNHDKMLDKNLIDFAHYTQSDRPRKSKKIPEHFSKLHSK